MAVEALEVAILFTYFVLFFYYLGRSFHQLHTRNYRYAALEAGYSGDGLSACLPLSGISLLAACLRSC